MLRSRRRAARIGIVLAVAFAGSGCATQFVGSAFVEEGRSGCEAKCGAESLEFVGMVYMGEYSDACVCALPGKAASVRRTLFASASTVAGAAGVMMQKQRQEQQRRQNATY